jgi:hypothetical protein
MSVAVVGLYPITSLGEGPEALRTGLAGSRSDGAPGGEVHVDVSEYTDTKHAYLDPATGLALAAACGAADDAGWAGSGGRTGLALGTAYGCAASLARHAATVVEKGGRLASPFVFSHAYPNSPNSVLSIDLGLEGYNCCFVCGSASGAAAIGAAFDQIRLGREERILAGGADARPGGDSGSCFLALEDETTAAREDRPARARILGCGCGTGEPAQVVENVLAEAGLSLSDLDASVGNEPVSGDHRCFDEVYGCPPGAAGVLDVASACILAAGAQGDRLGRTVAAVRRDPSGLTGVVLFEAPLQAGH